MVTLDLLSSHVRRCVLPRDKLLVRESLGPQVGGRDLSFPSLPSSQGTLARHAIVLVLPAVSVVSRSADLVCPAALPRELRVFLSLLCQSAALLLDGQLGLDDLEGTLLVACLLFGSD